MSDRGGAPVEHVRVVTEGTEETTAPRPDVAAPADEGDDAKGDEEE